MLRPAGHLDRLGCLSPSLMTAKRTSKWSKIELQECSWERTAHKCIARHVTSSPSRDGKAANKAS